jgi:hypothetical protein
MPKQPDKYKYRSALESRIAAQLIERGVEFGYETCKHKYRSRVVKGICGKCGHTDVYQQRTYTSDFKLATTGIELEVKGRLTSADRSKILLIVKQNPSLDLRLVFQYDNKLSKTNSMRYSEWATKHDIPYCIKEIPDSWLKHPTSK